MCSCVISERRGPLSHSINELSSIAFYWWAQQDWGPRGPASFALLEIRASFSLWQSSFPFALRSPHDLNVKSDIRSAVTSFPCPSPYLNRTKNTCSLLAGTHYYCLISEQYLCPILSQQWFKQFSSSVAGLTHQYEVVAASWQSFNCFLFLHLFSYFIFWKRKQNDT